MNKIHLEVLQENVNKLNLSAEWVQRSYEQTRAIEQKDVYSIDEN